MNPDTTKQKYYNPAQTIVITISTFFGAQFLAALALFIYPVIAGWSKDHINEWLATNWAQFLFVLVADILTLVILREFMKRRNIKWSKIGFNHPKSEHIGYALAGFAVYFVSFILLIIIIKLLIPSLDLEKEQQIGFSKSTTGIALLPIFMSLVILPPLIEEIMARGFLYTGLRNKLSFIKAAFITSILFSAAHLAGASSGLLWVAGIDTFILSMVMCYMREKSGSLWPSITLHFIKNGIAFVVLFNIAQYFR